MQSLDPESAPGAPDRPNPDNPHEDAVRAELERVLSSAIFQRSPKLRAFLRFVTEAVLEGQAERIKAYTIAVDALGRSPNFNPDENAIVRVDAVRLRYALKRYYDGEGGSDPIIISFSRGSYVPRFALRSSEPTRSVPLAPLWNRIAIMGRLMSAAGPILRNFFVRRG